MVNPQSVSGPVKAGKATSRAGRLESRPFRTEGSRRVALRPVRARDLPLPRQLFGALFLVLRARQRCHEGDEIIDLLLGQSEGLDVFVEVRVFDTVTLVVVVNDVPQRFLRAVVKIRPVTKILRISGVLNAAISASFLLVRKRPRAEKSVPTAARSTSSR
jgi:hypothetical protein